MNMDFFQENLELSEPQNVLNTKREYVPGAVFLVVETCISGFKNGQVQN